MTAAIGQVKSGIIGLCVGDALGVPVEFLTREELRADPVRDMREFGTYRQPAGTWSDDSSMALSLTDSLCSGKFDPEDVACRYVAWYREAKWTPHGHVFDIGNITRQALIRYASGMGDAASSGAREEYANGNGSLMRVLPLAYYLRGVPSMEDRIAVVSAESSITHAHIRSIIACAMYVEISIELLDGRALREAVQAGVTRVAGYFAGEPELRHYERIVSGELVELAKSEIQSTGYVVHTLEASLWCLLRTENYRDAVLLAVNLGEDTDTTAAVAGGLAGIVYGVDGIPGEWLEQLARRMEIEALCERFAVGVKGAGE